MSVDLRLGYSLCVLMAGDRCGLCFQRIPLLLCCAAVDFSNAEGSRVAAVPVSGRLQVAADCRHIVCVMEC